MYRKLSLILIVTLLTLGLFGTASSAAEKKAYDYLRVVKLYIGEKQAEVNFSPTTLDQAAFVKNGRTLVPFRFLGEALGAQIAWDSANNQATLKLATTEVKVSLGSQTAYVNGQVIKLDVPAESKGGRIFVPLRFASESLGADVAYEKDTELITITYVDSTNWKEYKDSETNEVIYKYPGDWVLETGPNVIPRVIAPTGSYVWQATRNDMNVTETIDALKQEYAGDNYVLQSEVYLNEEDLSEGKLLLFDSPDGKETDYVIVWKQAGTDDALIINETIKAGYYEIDDPVITEIIYG